MRPLLGFGEPSIRVGLELHRGSMKQEGSRYKEECWTSRTRP